MINIASSVQKSSYKNQSCLPKLSLNIVAT